jgi:protein SCO1/2
MRAALILALAVLVTAACLLLALSRDAPQHASLEPPLPKIAPAPEFALTSQDGAPVTLADYRGKVVAVTFILTMCTTTCPILTPMMSFVQDQLGRDFGAKISFVSITVTSIVDPHGILRVQYLGVRFDPEEFRRDLLSILKE